MLKYILVLPFYNSYVFENITQFRYMQFSSRIS